MIENFSRWFWMKYTRVFLGQRRFTLSRLQHSWYEDYIKQINSLQKGLRRKNRHIKRLQARVKELEAKVKPANEGSDK